jgi:hypothetical protein
VILRDLRLLLGFRLRQMRGRMQPGRRRPAEGLRPPRLLGRLLARLRPKRPTPPAGRRPTGRKVGTSILLIIVMPLLLLQSGIYSLRFLGVASQPPGAEFILPPSTLMKLASLADLRDARSQIDDENRRQARTWLTTELRLDNLPEAEQDARIDQMIETYDRSGGEAFASTDGLSQGIRLLHQDRPTPALMARIQPAATLFLLLCLALTICTPLGLQPTAWTQSGDPDRWFLALPIADRSLALARLLRLWLLNPWFWLTVPVFLVVLALVGRPGPAGWATLPLTIPLLGLLVAALSGLLEHLLGRLPASPRRWCQGLATLLGLGCFGLAMSLAHLPLLPHWFASLAGAVRSSPLIGLVQAVTGDPGALSALAVLTALVVMFWFTALRTVGRRLLPSDGDSRRRAGGGRAAPGLLDPAPKDLLLLGRDPRLLIQVLVVPGAIVGMNLIINLQHADGMLRDPRHLAALALCVALYLLIMIAPRSLANERRALWLLVATPSSLTRILWGKAVVWLLCALLYLGLGLGMSVWLAPGPALLGYGLYCLAAVVVFTALAVPAGALATDPFETRPQREVRLGVLYALMLVMSALVGAIYQPAWTRLVHLVLVGLLAIGAWQRFRGREAWILDPTESAPPRLDLLGALTVLWVFYVLQALVGGVALTTGMATGPAITLAFGMAGILTGGGTLLLVWRRRRLGQLRATLILPNRPGRRWRDLLVGALAGAAAASGGLAWVLLANHLGILPEMPAAGIPLPWMLVLTVVAAPLCEEFLFRGILLGGLRATLAPRWAVPLGALLFAIIHPPLSFPAVFTLGLTAGVLAIRSGWLLAPIVAHATYNLIVVLAGAG